MIAQPKETERYVLSGAGLIRIVIFGVDSEVLWIQQQPFHADDDVDWSHIDLDLVVTWTTAERHALIRALVRDGESLAEILEGEG